MRKRALTLPRGWCAAAGVRVLRMARMCMWDPSMAMEAMAALQELADANEEARRQLAGSSGGQRQVDAP